MTSKKEQLSDVLRKIRATIPEVIGAAVVSSEGFIVAAVFPSEVDEDLVGGMAASLLGVGERISVDLMQAPMEQVFVRSPRGYIIVNAIDANSSVVVLVSKEAKLGLIFIELRRAIAELLAVL
ncbi:MAG: roadblock/LC7 domain-containing protein [Myxococcaceae bacterium]